MPDNAALEFVDTNVLIYAYDASAGAKQVAARELIERLWQSRTGVLSVQVLQEFYVVVTQKVARPLDRQVAADIVASLAKWTVHTPDANDVSRAIELQAESGLSFWDAMIVNSARATRCAVLWSEDMAHDRAHGRVQVKNPFAS